MPALLEKYLILALYFAVLFGLGLLAARRVHSLEDFYVGGKKLGFWVVAFSTRATGASAWVLLGLTGMGAMMGVSAYWAVLGTALGEGTAWFFMAKPFKRLTDRYDSITIPDYLVSRFGATTHHLRILSASVLSVFVVVYVSAQIDATGSAFETFLGWGYYPGVLTGFAIVVLYTFSGGFVAVAWSDVFQGAIMLLGLVLLPAVALVQVGGIDQLAASLREIDPGLLSAWGTSRPSADSFFKILGLVMIGLGFLGSPQLFVRFMSVKDTRELDKGKWVSLALALLMNGGAVTAGILGRSLYTQPGTDPVAVLGNGGQNVLFTMVDSLLPGAVGGLYVAAVLAAIMSTIDSLLVVASSAYTRDIHQQVLHPETKSVNMERMSRLVTLCMALAALGTALAVAALSPGRTIFWFVIFGWSGIAAAFCPVIILSLAWKGFRQQGAVAAMITGFVCVLVFKFAAPLLPVAGPWFAHLSELLPAFAAALLAGVVASKLAAKKKGRQ